MGKSFNKYPPKIQKFCELCGSEYFVYPYRKDTAKYCSNKCSNKVIANLPYVKEIISKANIGNKRRHNSISRRFCGCCNKELYNHQKMFCSNKCASMIISKNAERIEKIRKSSLGRRHTQETKDKISFINKGRIRSEKTRQLLREIGKAQALKGQTKVFKPSKSEIYFGKRIKDTYNINLTSSKWIEGRCFDYNYKNYLFELDGERWHRLSYQMENDNLKNKIAERNGYTLYRFKLNRIRDVDNLIEQNKNIFDKIFNKE